MAYSLFQSTFFGDAAPVDSATYTDVVRANVQQLKVEAPAMTTWPIINTVPSSTAATYNDAAVLYRSPKKRLRPGASPFVMRTLRFYAFVRVSNVAGTGTLRAWAADAFKVPADTPDDNFVTAESTTTTSVPGEWKTWDLALRRNRCATTEDGFSDDEPAVPYLVTFVGIQGKITGGHTIYIDELAVEEITPI